ncbi:DUF7684 family protein [Asticcacaulis excentricus]|uniref:DUF7684 family protein n=1 Tax=Asticcacaulis excentricus TaxID=78587 RepID=UPI000F8468E4|nr:hypothetical protein [Asticcacaulis excentricus]
MEFEYLHITPAKALPELGNTPFRAVIIADMTVDKVWREKVAIWLVSSGCLYALAWGAACEAWHDAVDWANISVFGIAPIPDDHHVLTTWHPDESLAEVLWFAGHCASHPTVELKETRLIHVAESARRTEILKAYRLSQGAGRD